MQKNKELYIWGVLRIVMGWVFLWSFLDKVFGLGFSTPAAKSWLSGFSPTAGFLKMGTAGPFAGVFQGLAGNPLIDWLFMMGLLLIGLSLISGIGMKIASWSGALFVFLLWTAHLPPQQNPVVDEHIIYLIVFIGFYLNKAGHYFGFGKWWSQTSLVKKLSWLE